MPELEEGVYRAVVTGGHCSKSSQKGTPQIEIEIAVLGHQNPYTQQWEEGEYGTGRMYLSFHDNAIKYTYAKLRTIGWNGSAEAPDFSEEAKGIGVEVLLRKGQDQRGNARDEWDFKNWGGGQGEPVEATEATRIASGYQAYLKEQGEAAPKATAAPAPAPATPPPADPNPGGAIPTTTTKTEAWAAFCENSQGAPNLDEWGKAVTERGKPETAFTAEDWQAVTTSLITPF